MITNISVLIRYWTTWEKNLTTMEDNECLVLLDGACLCSLLVLPWIIPRPSQAIPVLHTRKKGIIPFALQFSVFWWVVLWLLQLNLRYLTIKLEFKTPKSFFNIIYIFWGVSPTPPKKNACSQKSGNVANVRTSRQVAKNLQFLSGCNF